MLFASLPVACVFAAVGPLAHTLTPLSTLLPLARVNVAFCSLEHTFAFCFSGEEFSLVHVAVRFTEPSFPVLTSVGPLALISSIVMPRLHAESMRSIVPIITLSQA